jgi:hypothetical protein
MLSALCDSGRLDYIGRLRPFRTVGNFEFHLLPCTKRFEALPRDPRIVNKHIIASGLLDEPVSLLCVKPLHYPFCQGRCPPFSKRSFQRHLISLINLDVKIFINKIRAHADRFIYKNSL